ncbi:putative hydrolase of the HAD superfamily [Sinobacterium caligoides]|uniref:Putative hydrolase of the HAD superfamily n=1 Tax=Sinobacterium caligoides TaxID=933926 RepID=A0A3N2DGM0_9GAMM|nr:GMP/IMP nucleotidase [Sinobacterium caligoides]ROR98881.1 putative hydrolase of the HAD superfamily [Sinobacterium caligoides]
MNWRDIDTVLLDMDGTLLDLHFDNFFWLHHLPRRYSEINDISIELASQRLNDRYEEIRGSLDWYCLDYWREQLQLDIVALKREIFHLIAVRPHVEAFLAALQTQGKQVILVTNAHRDSLELKMEKIDLRPWFNALVVSHDYRQPKESQAFWQQLQAEHSFDAERTLFVDDTEAILASAERFGIGHLLTLSQPDSQAALRQGLRYPQIHHFDEIMPVLPASTAR